MRIHIGKKDVAWSYLGNLLNIGANVLLLPVILRCLPQKELGLWYTFASIGGLVSLLDFGFSPTVQRNVTYVWGGVRQLLAEGLSAGERSENPNFLLLSTLMEASKRVYNRIALAVLGILLIPGSFYIGYVTRDISSWAHWLSWGFYIVAVVLNVVYGRWGPFLSGIGAVKESQQIQIVSKVVYICLAALLLFCGVGLFSIVLAFLVSGLVLRIMYRRTYERCIECEQKKCLGDVSGSSGSVDDVLSVIWVNARKLGVVFFGAFLINQANTLVCSAGLGLEETAQYGLSQQIVSLMVMFSGIFFSAYQPALAEANARHDVARLKHLLAISMTVAWLCLAGGGVAVFFFGDDLLALLGTRTQLLPVIPLALLIVFKALEQNHSLFSTVIVLGNKVPFVSPAIFSGLAILVLSVASVKLTALGVLGLVLAQGVVQLLYNNWKWPALVMRDLHVSPFALAREGGRFLLARACQAIARYV